MQNLIFNRKRVVLVKAKLKVCEMVRNKVPKTEGENA